MVSATFLGVSPAGQVSPNMVSATFLGVSPTSKASKVRTWYDPTWFIDAETTPDGTSHLKGYWKFV